MKLVKHLANLGYGSRKEVQQLIRSKAVTDDTGRVLDEKKLPPHETIRLNGEPLDPAAPFLLMLHKPLGYTCSTEDPGETIYDLLPPRFRLRSPVLSPVGRLDKETTGLVLMTDDGQLLHKLISPKHEKAKVYHVTLDRPMEGTEAEIFASGDMLLRGENKSLLPAELVVLNDKEALLTLHEGRYHQARRMFAAVGNHVIALHRQSIGGLELPSDLTAGEWRALTKQEEDRLRT